MESLYRHCAGRRRAVILREWEKVISSCRSDSLVPHQIYELYRFYRERLRHPFGTPEFATADVRLRQQVALMAEERDAELAADCLRQPGRKAIASLH